MAAIRGLGAVMLVVASSVVSVTTGGASAGRLPAVMVSGPVTGSMQVTPWAGQSNTWIQSWSMSLTMTGVSGGLPAAADYACAESPGAGSADCTATHVVGSLPAAVHLDRSRISTSAGAGIPETSPVPEFGVLPWTLSATAELASGPTPLSCNGTALFEHTGASTSATFTLDGVCNLGASEIVPVTTACAPSQLCWSDVTPSFPPSAADQLFSVSCPAPTFCVAVGQTQPTPTTVASVVLRWDGRRWTTMQLPPGTYVGNVSCTSPTFCLALGGTTAGAPATIRWDGSAWTTVAAPAPGGLLGGLSCSDPTFCMAVGYAFDPNDPFAQLLFAERWDGSAWSVAQPVTPLAEFQGLSSVSCTSSTFCMAVGDVNGSPVAVRWDGSTWSLEPSIDADSPTEPELLSSVSCTSPSFCFAVGLPRSVPLPVVGSSVTEVWSEKWNGTTWTPTPTPSPTSANFFLASGVSCVSPTSCTAVGGDGTGLFPQAAAQHWNGETWLPMVTSKPAWPLGWTELAAVSCSRPAVCLGGGFNILQNPQGEHALAELYDNPWGLAL